MGYRAITEFRISAETARKLGTALGSIAFDQAKKLECLPANTDVPFDCVGVEESDIWELVCDQYFDMSEDGNSDPNYHICFDAMYEEARRLQAEHFATKRDDTHKTEAD